MEVYKFGGTCTASVEKLKRITEIIELEGSFPLIITLSAAAGVTNQLKEILGSTLDENLINQHLDSLKKQHVDLLDKDMVLPTEIDELLQRLERLLYGLYYTEELTQRTYDLVMTFGERLIAPILQLYLANKGHKVTIAQPEDFIVTDGQHENALVLLDKTEALIKKKLLPLCNEYDIIIVPGFYGVSEDHTVTILGRSGTDYTGTVLAHGLDASAVTIWKDVLGFMSADPRLVKSAHTIPELSYQEAAELAFFGAKLLHPRAASPARIKNIPIYIRHIDHLDSSTCINSDNTKIDDSIIKSVSHMTDLAILKVYATVGGNTKGVMATIADKIREAGGNTISIATSQTCIAFLLLEKEAADAAKKIETLGPGLVDYIEIKPNTALICVVGEGLGRTPGVAARVFEATSKMGVNVDMISAGASATAYHFTVDEKDLQRALEGIHSNFFEGSQ